jgi:hypothetical protein
MASMYIAEQCGDSEEHRAQNQHEGSGDAEQK